MNAKGMPRLGISIMDVLANEKNYFLWSDGTSNVHTSSARTFVDLRVLIEEFETRKRMDCQIPVMLFYIEDKATDHRNFYRIYFNALLVKSRIVDYVGFLWFFTGHSHGPNDQLIGGCATRTRGSKHGLLNETNLNDVLNAVESDAVGQRLNVVEELDEFADLQKWVEKVCFVFFLEYMKLILT